MARTEVDQEGLLYLAEGLMVKEICVSLANRRPVMKPCSQLTVDADNGVTDFRLSEWLRLAVY